MQIYINGEYFEKADAKISVFDHGLLYGDGVFEGIRVYDNKVFRLDEHLERLYESAKAIDLTIPLSKDKLKKDTLEAVRRNKLTDAYIRLIVTRGIGSLGLNPYICGPPGIIIIVDKIALYPKELYEKGLALVTVATQRNLPEAVNPRIKSLNYLNNILAKIEAINAGVEEAIMLNSFGLVSECAGDNIFAVRKGILLTPSISMGVLEGITRNDVIRMAREKKIEVKQVVMTRHDLFIADECFLTGSAAEIVPVIKIDGRVIGDGRPGAITRDLMKSYHRLTRKEGVPVRSA
ncbi:MAG: branched-chain-amino-acid transaminase [Candidatus Euphemobacter frigidus]|nr:branched-chain-amino-acid transaminase [Candidatus Euphemobacter frigidus]MDP8275815.1 branched-chain-amino-acid transaminase [Candidatus Euphemobacter frigidus]